MQYSKCDRIGRIDRSDHFVAGATEAPPDMPPSPQSAFSFFGKTSNSRTYRYSRNSILMGTPRPSRWPFVRGKIEQQCCGGARDAATVHDDRDFQREKLCEFTTEKLRSSSAERAASEQRSVEGWRPMARRLGQRSSVDQMTPSVFRSSCVRQAIMSCRCRQTSAMPGRSTTRSIRS